ncbi:UNVERIFIED_CONTAM: hypothetical protein RMT77_015642 [Armadillidium vulgare]
MGYNKVIPIIIGFGVIVMTGIIAKLFLGRKKRPPITLKDPTVKYSLELIEKEHVSHNTRRFRFKLPSKEHILGLPIGQHVFLSARIGGQLVVRTYTPVSSDEDKGYMDLVIKIYSKNVHPKYPEGGKMSQHLDSLKLGDCIDVRGPTGSMEYQGEGVFSIKRDKKSSADTVLAKKLNMIAGGTGITPILQLIRDIVRNPKDKTEMRLIFANQTEEDILLRQELEEVANSYPDRFKLWYTISTANEGWKYSTGHVDADMISHHMFPPSNDTLVLMCGPPAMIKNACIPNLDKLKYSANMRFAY